MYIYNFFFWYLHILNFYIISTTESTQVPFLLIYWTYFFIIALYFILLLSHDISKRSWMHSDYIITTDSMSYPNIMNTFQRHHPNSSLILYHGHTESSSVLQVSHSHKMDLFSVSHIHTLNPFRYRTLINEICLTITQSHTESSSVWHTHTLNPLQYCTLIHNFLILSKYREICRTSCCNISS